MPQAPVLTPDQASAMTGASAGIDPTKLLVAAADLHSSGQLSAPVPTGPDPLKQRKPSRHGPKVMR